MLPLPMSSLVWVINLRDRSCAAFSIVARPEMYWMTVSDHAYSMVDDVKFAHLREGKQPNG